MQPFTKATLYTVLLGVSAYYICYFLFDKYQGFGWLVLRSSCFLALYASGTMMLKLSADIMPIWQSLQRRAGIKKGH